MTNRKRFAVVAVFGLAAITLWFGWTRVLDTSANRRRVSGEVRTLVQSAKANPGDTTIANNLLRRARSGYSFEATIATVGLGEIGDAAIPVIGEIADLMDSPDPYVRREAAITLSNLGKRSTPVLEKLVRQVSKRPSDDESWFAAEAIAEIGKPAIEHIPLLKSRIGTGAVQFDNSLRSAIATLEKLRDSDESHVRE
jgi:hypothetical protein